MDPLIYEDLCYPTVEKLEQYILQGVPKELLLDHPVVLAQLRSLSEHIDECRERGLPSSIEKYYHHCLQRMMEVGFNLFEILSRI